MKLSAFTDRRFIDLSVDAKTKEDLVVTMVDLLSRSKRITDKQAFLRDVLDREELVTTGVGYGVAFPHAKSSAVRGVAFAVGRTRAGVDFGALDGEVVRLVFLIGAPKSPEPSRVYLNLMARLSFLMKDGGNRRLLIATDSVEDVLRLLDTVK